MLQAPSWVERRILRAGVFGQHFGSGHLSDRPAHLDVNDDGIAHVDEIVGDLCEKGVAALSS